MFTINHTDYQTFFNIENTPWNTVRYYIDLSLSILILLSNGCLLIGLYKTKQLKSRSNKLYALLSSTDTALGVVLFSSTINQLCNKVIPSSIDTVLVSVKWYATMLSPHIVSWISTHKCLAIICRNFYQRYCGRKVFLLVFVTTNFVLPLTNQKYLECI